MKIRIAGITPESVVDGPGIRLVFFMQGCVHDCPGCHNPATHDLTGGREIDVAELIDQLQEAKLIRGITLSGGEPFLQAEALLPLVQAAKERGLTVTAYSGYRFEELQAKTAAAALLQYIDLLIDGRFIQEQRDLKLAFRGSANQRLVDVMKSLQQGQTVAWQEANAW
ncbi:anaerobic ribonucleoside-triphosphate reductase activating protein [Azotosporobacter soli]|uniref:anaerobic ribonucleoside-triphosphate reductase activating protein n=1 Tax=Azotosporobacter soli TaxID=3055040 RepID=UPI0031FE8092